MHSPTIEALLKFPPEARSRWLRSLSRTELIELGSMPEFWLRREQREPEDYYLWMLITGRGWGKTFTASHLVHKWAHDKRAIGSGAIVLCGATYSDVRTKMVEAQDGGLLSTAPRRFRPDWKPGNGRGKLIWPNGVIAYTVSGGDYDTIRGLNISRIWCDEFAAWANPEEAWRKAIAPALRKRKPKGVVTSTPIPLPFLDWLMQRRRVVVTRGSTFDNPVYDEEFLEQIRDQYEEGSAIYRQEILGEIVMDDPRALFTHEVVAKHRTHEPPNLIRKVIGVDPGTDEHGGGDKCGIVVVGEDERQHFYVLADETTDGNPRHWAPRVRQLVADHGADLVVAERNNGGQMVEMTLSSAAPGHVPYKSVWSSHGKITRAEPVANLYRRGYVHHVGQHKLLESQMCNWWPGCGKPSPDRMDALVFGIVEMARLGQDQEKGSIWGYAS